MRVKITYVDTHFGDGLTSDDIEAEDVYKATQAWYRKHMNCSCKFVNAHQS